MVYRCNQTIKFEYDNQAALFYIHWVVKPRRRLNIFIGWLHYIVKFELSEWFIFLDLNQQKCSLLIIFADKHANLIFNELDANIITPRHHRGCRVARWSVPRLITVTVKLLHAVMCQSHRLQIFFT